MTNFIKKNFLKFFAVFSSTVLLFNASLIDLSIIANTPNFIVHADGPVPGNDCGYGNYNHWYGGFDCYIRGIYQGKSGYDNANSCFYTNQINYSNGNHWYFCDPVHAGQYTNTEVIIHVQFYNNSSFTILEFVNFSVKDVPPSDPNLINPQNGWNMGPLYNGQQSGVNCDNSGTGAGCSVNLNILASDPDFFRGNGVNGYINTNETLTNSTNGSLNTSIFHQSTNNSDNFTDNRTLKDGYWNWSANSTDNYNKTSNSVSRSFLVDTTAPSQPVLNTLPQFSKGNQITLNSSISTDNLIGGVTYQFQRADDSIFTSNVQSSGWISGNSFTFASLVDNHTYFYRVQSKDSLNNTTGWSSTLSSVQDATPPVISIISIDNLKIAPIGGTVKTSTITSTYSDLNLTSYQIDLVKVLDNSIVRTFNQNNIATTPNTSSFTWDGKDSLNNFVSDGAYNVKVTVTDKAGNQTIDNSKYIIVKNTPASISVSSPIDGAWFNTSNITIHGQTDPAATLNIKRCNDISCLSPIESRGATLDITGIFNEQFNVTDGENIFILTSTDTVGNTLSKTFKYYIDKSQPVINSITPNSLINNTKPTITLNLTDLGPIVNTKTYISGIDTSKIYLSITHNGQSEFPLVSNGTNVAPQLGTIQSTCNTAGAFGNSKSPSCTYSFVFNNALQPDGNWTINSSIRDIAGNCSGSTNQDGTCDIDKTQNFELDSHTQDLITAPVNGQLFNYSQILLKGTSEKRATLVITGLSDTQSILIDTSSTTGRITVNNCRAATNPLTDGIKEICDWSVGSFQLKKNISPGNLSNPISFKLTDPAGNIDNQTVTPNIDLYAVSLSITSDLQYFSPNGDGYQDGIGFQGMATTGVLGNWEIRINNSSNVRVKTISGNTSLPTNFPWAGKDNSNNYLTDGVYTYYLYIQTTDSISFSTTPQTITAVTTIKGAVIITYPGNNSFTTEGVINVQGQAPVNTIVRICDSVVGLTNNCDVATSSISVNSSGFFTTVIPLNRLPNQNYTQHYLVATARDKFGNTTPDSNKVEVTITNQTPFQNVAIIPAYTGVNNQANYKVIIDKLNQNQPITQADINTLRSVVFRSTVSQGTERVKLAYADRTNLKQLPPTTQFSNIGYIDGNNQTHLYQNFTDGSTPQTSCVSVNCTWDFTYPVPPIGGGLYEIQFDGKLGGTIQDLSAPLTIDGNVPAAPLILTIDKIVGSQDQPTNIFNNSFYSNSNTVLIKGVSDPNNIIKVLDQNNKTICIVTSSSIGFWSCQVDISTISGYSNLNTQVSTLNLSITATLNANTTNSIFPKTLIIDEIKPLITSLNTSNIWHKSGDIADLTLSANKILSYAINTDRDPGVGGNCINAPLQQNAVSELFINSNLLGATGSFQIPGYAIEGRYCTQIEVQDIAGNRTDANLVFNIDNTVPNIPTIDTSQWGIFNGYYAQGGSIATGRLNPGYVVKTSSVQITGLGEENMNIELFVNGVMKGTAISLNHLQSNSCNYSKYPDPLQSVPNTPYQNLSSDRSFDSVITEYQYQCPYSFNYTFDSGEIGYNLQVKAKDLAGNETLISNGTLIYYDKTAPQTPETPSVTDSNSKTINDWQYATNQNISASNLGTGNFGKLPITNQNNLIIKSYAEPLSDNVYTFVDRNGVTQSQVLKENTGSGYESKSYSLTSGDGVYTFYAQSWDAPGNASGSHLFQVELDTQAPGTPSVQAGMSDQFHISMNVNGEAGSFSTVGQLNHNGFASGIVRTLDINKDSDWNHSETFCSKLVDRAGNSSSYNCSTVQIPIRPVRAGECDLTDIQKAQIRSLTQTNKIQSQTDINNIVLSYYSQSCQTYEPQQIFSDVSSVVNIAVNDVNSSNSCISKQMANKCGTDKCTSDLLKSLCHLDTQLVAGVSTTIYDSVNKTNSFSDCLKNNFDSQCHEGGCLNINDATNNLINQCQTQTGIGDLSTNRQAIYTQMNDSYKQYKDQYKRGDFTNCESTWQIWKDTSCVATQVKEGLHIGGEVVGVIGAVITLPINIAVTSVQIVTNINPSSPPTPEQITKKYLDNVSSVQHGFANGSVNIVSGIGSIAKSVFELPMHLGTYIGSAIVTLGDKVTHYDRLGTGTYNVSDYYDESKKLIYEQTGYKLGDVKDDLFKSVVGVAAIAATVVTGGLASGVVAGVLGTGAVAGVVATGASIVTGLVVANGISALSTDISLQTGLGQYDNFNNICEKGSQPGSDVYNQICTNGKFDQAKFDKSNIKRTFNSDDLKAQLCGTSNKNVNAFECVGNQAGMIVAGGALFKIGEGLPVIGDAIDSLSSLGRTSFNIGESLTLSEVSAGSDYIASSSYQFDLYRKVSVLEDLMGREGYDNEFYNLRGKSLEDSINNNFDNLPASIKIKYHFDNPEVVPPKIVLEQEYVKNLQDNGLLIMNKRYAGQTIHFSSPKLIANNYPDGIDIYYDINGFPDFRSFVYNKVVVQVFDLKGDYIYDFILADKEAGITKSFRIDNGLTWHHNEDGITMELIPSVVNDVASHTGGAAIIRLKDKINN